MDVANSSKLLSNTTTGTEASITWMRVPVWINLSSEKVKAITSTNGTAGNDSLEVKFGSSDPVEEHNSFKLKVIDNNPVKEELNAKELEPQSFNVENYKGNDGKASKDKINEKFDKGTVSNEEDAQAFLNNMEIMENAEITSNVVDDTVYVNVKANLRGLQELEGQSNVIKVPLSFDVSPLGTKKGDNISLWRLATKKWVHWQQEEENSFILKIRYKDGEVDEKYKDLKEGKKVTEEFIVATGNITDSSDVDTTEKALQKVADQNAKYVRYVVTFEQN